jgi:hypothetical protein
VDCPKRAPRCGSPGRAMLAAAASNVRGSAGVPSVQA